MLEKRGKLLIVLLQISLLISLSFGISFILSQENIVFADDLPRSEEITSIKANIVNKGTTTPVTFIPTKTGTLRPTLHGSGQALHVDIPATSIKEGAGAVSGELGGLTPNADGTATAIVNGNQVILNKEGAAQLQSAVTTAGAGLEGSYSYKLPLLGTEFTGAVAHLVEGLFWAGVAYGAIKLASSLFGFDKNLEKALTYSVLGTIGVWKGLRALGELGVDKTNFFVSNAPWIGLGVGIAIFLLTYKKEKKRLVSFQCLPFEPPLGGAQCEACNKDPFRPCSEYRCKSLGQACQLLNVGSDREQCAWVSKFDVNSPVIAVWNDALGPKELALRAVPDNAIRPPHRGFKLVSNKASGCVPAFTPLQFGITLNEPGQCKIDYDNNKSFADMQFYVGESNYFQYNHTQGIRLPGPDTGEAGPLAPVLENDGTFNLYMRCQDANGNANVDLFAISYCVDKGPDTTPPIMEETSIISGSPVQFDADSVPIELFVNEPSECKWSRTDKDYSDMENSMGCKTSSFQVNAQLQYSCVGNLTGIKNKEENKFYFRCKDQPGKAESERNTNAQSFPLTLRGSQPLNIIASEPNGTIVGATTTLPVAISVTTDDGSDEGVSICGFSTTGAKDSYIPFFETNSYNHKQTLDLTTGAYALYIRCIDAGGNAAYKTMSFSVLADKDEPTITRIYREGTGTLKVVTNEDAQCEYSLSSCNFNFEQGIKLIASADDQRVHVGQWQPKVTYFIKCKDLYGNEPGPNECLLEASATQIAELRE